MEKKFSKIKLRIHEHLEYIEMSKRAFYQKTGISNGTLDKKTGLSEDNLEKYISAFPEINLHWLIHGKGEMFKTERYKNDVKPGVIGEPEVIKFEDNGKANVVMLSTKAASELATNLDNASYFESQPHFHFPILPDKDTPYICIEAEGDSMHPTVKHKDWVIGERIFDVSNLKEDCVHILLTSEGPVIKRLSNRIEERSKIVCQSDNCDYSSYEVEIGDVLAVYRAKFNLSADFSNLNAQHEMRRDIDYLKNEIEKLKGKK